MPRYLTLQKIGKNGKPHCQHDNKRVEFHFYIIILCVENYDNLLNQSHLTITGRGSKLPKCHHYFSLFSFCIGNEFDDKYFIICIIFF